MTLTNGISFIIVFLLFSLSTYSQNYSGVKGGTVSEDSINHTYTTIIIKNTDTAGVPLDYQLTTRIYRKFQPKNYILLNVEDSTFISRSIRPLPDSCFIWRKVYKEKRSQYYYFDNDSVKSFCTIESKNMNGTQSSGPDSIRVLDNNCVKNYYYKDTSDYSDTFYLNKQKRECSTFQRKNMYCDPLVIHVCEYYVDTRYNNYVDLKHNEEIKFYMPDLSDPTWMFYPPVIEYRGTWKYGKKHGHWYYYDEYGNLVKREKYRNGELKTTKYFS